MSAVGAHGRDDRVVACAARGRAAFARGWLEEAEDEYWAAVSLWEARVEPVTEASARVGASLYHNLGLVYFNQSRPDAAVQAFLRALDGRPESREQTLRFLVTAEVGAGRLLDARRHLTGYEASFGPHPEGWTVEGLERSWEEQRERRAPHVPC